MMKHDQQVTFSLISLGALAFFGALSALSPSLFPRFFGAIHPMVVAAVAMVIGGLSVRSLLLHGRFTVVKSGSSYRELALALILSTGFATVAVIADCFFVRYPADINVAWPMAVLFYPAMGYVVEIFFHVAPLAVLWVGLGRIRARLGETPFAWLCIALIGMLEPTFQVAMERKPQAFTWLHVYTFNVAQLYLFFRYDFLSMASLRLFYYVYWHVLWGTARLHLLF